MIISIYTSQNTQPTTQEEKPMVILTTKMAQNTIDLSQKEEEKPMTTRLLDLIASVEHPQIFVDLNRTLDFNAIASRLDFKAQCLLDLSPELAIEQSEFAKHHIFRVLESDSLEKLQHETMIFNNYLEGTLSNWILALSLNGYSKDLIHFIERQFSEAINYANVLSYSHELELAKIDPALKTLLISDDDCEPLDEGEETEVIEIEIRNANGMSVSLTNKEKEKLAKKLHKTIFKFLAKKGI
jgi:hypothetical protein